MDFGVSFLFFSSNLKKNIALAGKVWKEYVRGGASAVIFMVDAADRCRLADSKKVLKQLVELIEIGSQCPWQSF